MRPADCPCGQPLEYVTRPNCPRCGDRIKEA